MKNRQILWAIVFGSMLAITGCGSEDGGSGDGGSSGSGGSAGTGGSAGSGGSAGTGGSDGSDFCSTLCDACGGGQADCEQACEFGFGSIPPQFLDSCPSELQTLADCFGANDCDSTTCDSEVTAWTTCVTMNIQG